MREYHSIRQLPDKQMEVLPAPAESSLRSRSDGDVDHFLDDRRLADLLPTDLVRQIGLDPNTYLFDHPTHRRNTAPVVASFGSPQPHSRRSISLDQPVSYQPFLTPVIKNWFTVELSDSTVVAFSLFPISAGSMGSVVIRDAQYFRIGAILDRLPTQMLTPLCTQICVLDRNSELSDYLTAASQIAQTLAISFLKAAACRARLEKIEFVSKDRRATLKVELSRLDDPGLELFVRLMIQVFASPIELVGG
jgi:hypothetical protein